MQLWTIQPFRVWQEWQREGALCARSEHVTASWWGRDNLNAYNWLREQMIERIGPPPEADFYPTWAYFQFADATRRRPDLRTVRSWHPRGARVVLLELRADASHVLLSDFETWHYVLNDWYLPVSEEDGEAFEAASHPDEIASRLKRASWVRCLDLAWEAPGIASAREEKTIQATFWQLPLTDVVSVREFTGRGNPQQFAAP